jgi:hypothetical protein
VDVYKKETPSFNKPGHADFFHLLAYWFVKMTGKFFSSHYPIRVSIFFSPFSGIGFPNLVARIVFLFNFTSFFPDFTL